MGDVVPTRHGVEIVVGIVAIRGLDRLWPKADRGGACRRVGAMSTSGAESAAAPTRSQDFTVVADSPRRAIFVVGAGRSGISTMSAILQALGVHVPQPEVSADATNPKGLGEPKWVVDFHEQLLRRSNVQVADARPQAWFEAGKLATNDKVRENVFSWLGGQFAEGHDEIVLKDPRLAWFIGLWRSAALRCAATPSYITMLRPVTEVVGSKQLSYSQRFGEINRTASWVNVMLHTERGTRGSQRAFVRYHDLLKDWTVPLFELGEQFDLHSVKSATANNIRLVHNFIDPTLRQVSLTWDDIDVPKSLREIAEESWQALRGLAEPGGDDAKAHKTLDDLRAAYALSYADAEAISQSSVVAARREGAQERRPATPPAAPPASGSAAQRLAARVPHRVRAKIPPKARRAVLRALGR